MTAKSKKGGIRPMYQVKDLTQLTVKDLWKEVKDEEGWWGEINQRVMGMVKLVLERSLEEELIEFLQASRYVRTEVRRGYRNGCYERSLYSQYGVIKALRIPRARTGYPSKIVPNYQRRQPEINRMIREMFLAGVSTRRVGEVLQQVWGQAVSAQTVSNICQSLDHEVAAYHSRKLVDRYRYLLFDGIVLKVKGALNVQRKPVLTAYGITAGGQKELIDFRQASSESETQWEAFLRTLFQRGLEGSKCQLISIDGCPGLHRALETVYPYIPIQRCWAHKLRNVANHIRRRDQKECLNQARRIYLAENRRSAVKAFKEWESHWLDRYSEAVKCLKNDLDELLNFLDCPVAHRVKIRTTNAIERAFREVRRRTRTMSCFTNERSVDRIIFGVFQHLNKSWKDKPLPKFTQTT
jgi:transposase-like protein